MSNTLGNYILIFFLAAFLTGCGQYGPLYLPIKDDASTSTNRDVQS